MMSLVSPTKLSVVFLVVGSVALSGCATKTSDAIDANLPSARALVDVPDRYQVRFGDTVSGISARYGLNWREVSAINRLDSNHTIRVGQWLILKGASRTVPRVPYAKPVTTSRAPYYPPVARQIPTTPQPQAVPVQPPLAPSSEVVIAPIVPIPVSRPAQVQSVQPESSIFIYPASPSNVVVKRFGVPLDNGITEGIFLSGRAGDVVVASKTGVASIVKMGRGERSMIVLEHEGGYSTTYLDIQETTIRPRQTIRVGDKLGVMAAQTASGLALFEFRVSKDGRYIDPIAVLP